MTSAVGLSVGEQRQAENGDQSIKAYFAAESGAEDAMLKVKTNILRGIPALAGTHQNCTAPVQVDASNPEVYYTCQTVNTSVNKMEGSLAVEQAGQIGPVTGASNIVLNWHQFGTDPGVVSGSYTAPSNFPNRAGWSYPAAMELTVLSYDGTGTGLINPACPSGCANGIKVLSTLISPAGGGTGSITSPTNSGLCSSGNVITTGGYNCTINLSGFNSSLTYFLRLRARYAGGHYQVKFFNGASSVSEPSQNAIIDVTARAGNVYRRVEVQIPITTGPVSGLDYVLFSDTDICKSFNVSGNSATGLCAPSP